MKIAITSDIHFHNFKSQNQISFADIQAVFEQIVMYCENNSIESLFILGDLFHIKGKIHVPTFNKVHDLLKEASKKLSIYLIAGNHDYTYDSTENTTSIYSLQELDGVKIVNNKVICIDNCALYCIPYHKNLEEAATFVKQNQVAANYKKIIFTHGDVVGAVDQNYVCEKGFAPTTFIDDVDKIFIGHIHHPQSLYKDKIILPGSPLCHTKKDLNEDNRGFIVLDCETGLYERVLTQYPKFLSFTVNCIDELDSILSSSKKLDFIFITTTFPLKACTSIIEKFREYRVFYEESLVKTPQMRLNVKLEYSEDFIIREYVQKYGEGKEDLKNLGKELIETYGRLESEGCI